MKYFGKFLLIAAFLVSFPATVWSQATLQVVEKKTLKFGEWAADQYGTGTVTIGPNADSAMSAGGLISFGGIVRRARFQLIGEPKAYVTVTLPTSITISKGTSGHTMTVDSFTMNLSNPVRLGKTGKKTIKVGARLHVGANQKKGNYNDANTFFFYADYQ